NANTSISSVIFALLFGQPAKRKMVGTPRCSVRTAQRAVPTSFNRDRFASLVFAHEFLAKSLECFAFNFRTRPVHQVQIKMQIVQRDQAKPENFLRLDEMTDIAARKSLAGFARAIFLYWTFVHRELCVL